MDSGQITQIRSFNRTLTRRLGVLSESFLGMGRPLSEARLLFEIGRHGAELRALRARLSLDSGYLSRLLRSLEGQGLIRLQRAEADSRVRVATLTRKGLREFDELDLRSEQFAASVLVPLGPAQRDRLVAAMAEVERFMRAAAVTVEAADPAGGEARACLRAYFEELQARFDGGFDPERSVSADPGELMPPRGQFLVARLDGEAIGCGAFKAIGRGVGEIKRMWVAPAARGLGVAKRLLDALQAHAAEAGMDVLRLDTHRALKEAQALYLRNGYREIARYNDNPYAHHWFEKTGLRKGARRGRAGKGAPPG
ncbi:bifunctional helix-turn-helix transcriptional regulator/GNAT family N-acetyltransferase [Luteimonas aquatica]|uniref:bifunctional helix-turn-helix transcriptional regulator/GNAT family N-acetyltransferase n=1 Tax=Luteimonas aquatica TaxID=450364 RepID=UPI001F589AE8|nr:helix-turn-helix domain-containing GNAT family N-acetyltransferase [Luteimonas aquatica]